ncbi:MAG: tetratricopeptide repeat protein, partial [bacterium]|nr:tetratricopeptide repeat protein [bacterium]
PHLPAKKTFYLDLSPIKTVLENAGIAGPVTLELRDREKNTILNLGAWDNPASPARSLSKLEKVQIARETMRKMHIRRVMESITLFGAENCFLVSKNAKGKAEIKAAVTCYFPFRYMKPEYAVLDVYLIAGNIPEAIKYCKKQTGKIRHECYHILSESLSRANIEFLIKAKRFNTLDRYSQKVKEVELEKHNYRIAADVFFRKKEYRKALEYFSQTGFKESNNRMAEIYKLLGNLEKAAEFYEKGIPSARRAWVYGQLADGLKKEGKNKAAKQYYQQAVTGYEDMIKSINLGYKWTDEDNSDRLRCRRELAMLPKTPEETAREKKLGKILQAASDYCNLLGTEMIKFFCSEHIEEVVLESRRSSILTFVYEYQLVKENKKISERRIILKRNGRKTKKVEAPLGTAKYKYEKLIFGPFAFFKKSQQRFYDYKIVNKELFNGQAAVVVEAIPLQNFNIEALVGKIWFNEKDYGILKIEWHPKFAIKNFRAALDDARERNCDPDVVFLSEFGVKRGPIRYPSTYKIEEYFVTEDGKKYLQAKIHAEFKKYM